MATTKYSHQISDIVMTKEDLLDNLMQNNDYSFFLFASLRLLQIVATPRIKFITSGMSYIQWIDVLLRDRTRDKSLVEEAVQRPPNLACTACSVNNVIPR